MKFLPNWKKFSILFQNNAVIVADQGRDMASTKPVEWVAALITRSAATFWHHTIIKARLLQPYFRGSK